MSVWARGPLNTILSLKKYKALLYVLKALPVTLQLLLYCLPLPTLVRYSNIQYYIHTFNNSLGIEKDMR
jgi:hypothetical protein